MKLTEAQARWLRKLASYRSGGTAAALAPSPQTATSCLRKGLTIEDPECRSWHIITTAGRTALSATQTKVE
ncbi:hypothetical protein ABNQ39_20430 [Azospirillum sp. A26]|uniref:hypothetical protein n=1 Tax=Azospirillum sp. A26 TaxID=3160607 RepID=UPI003670A35D